MRDKIFYKHSIKVMNISDSSYPLAKRQLKMLRQPNCVIIQSILAWTLQVYGVNFWVELYKVALLWLSKAEFSDWLQQYQLLPFAACTLHYHFRGVLKTIRKGLNEIYPHLRVQLNYSCLLGNEGRSLNYILIIYSNKKIFNISNLGHNLIITRFIELCAILSYSLQYFSPSDKSFQSQPALLQSY